MFCCGHLDHNQNVPDKCSVATQTNMAQSFQPNACKDFILEKAHISRKVSNLETRNDHTCDISYRMSYSTKKSRCHGSCKNTKKSNKRCFPF